MRFSLIMLSAAFLLAVKLSADEAPTTGTIRGVVLADDGRPLAGATVFWAPRTRVPPRASRKITQAYTDAVNAGNVEPPSHLPSHINFPPYQKCP